MGQEASTPIDESTPPARLRSRTVNGVAQYIKDGRAKRIVVMTGAGISTSAGIPDFRSPDTGLYANLARLNLPYAEAVFDISYFRTNPQPFYTLARELYPGKYRPTITHSFISLLHRKGLLLKLFTQNIDCLEREAGLPGDQIVEAHGSFAMQRCIECKLEYPDVDMQEMIRTGDVPTCHQCEGLVKPDIVFFGEQLPENFFKNKNLPSESDLCIVMGTSLTVHPFAMLPQLVSSGVPRLLINQEQVGDLGGRADDVLLLGDCDSGVRRLAEACGWLEELEALWAETAREEDRATEAAAKAEAANPRSKEEMLNDEVEKLTKEVEQTLKISQGHADFLNVELGRKQKEMEDKVSHGEIATAGSYHASTQTTSSKPPTGKDKARFASSIESYITTELHSLATSASNPDVASIAKSISSASFSPASLPDSQLRTPDAQWKYLSPLGTTSNPSFVILIGSLDSDDSTTLDKDTLAYFSHSPDLNTVLTVSPKAASIPGSKRAKVKLWQSALTAKSSHDNGGSSPVPQCKLDADFRSNDGEVLGGKLVIPLIGILPPREALDNKDDVEDVKGVGIEVPFVKLVEWLADASGTKEGGKHDEKKEEAGGAERMDGEEVAKI